MHLTCYTNTPIPAPVVVTTLALLRAPSPLVVYAATVTEYDVSACKPVMKASWGRREEKISG